MKVRKDNILENQPVTGTVTANAGTNLNTSSLALETTATSIKTAVEILDNAIYTEGDVDATITGTPLMWEDGGNTLVVASAGNPLPVSVANNVSLAAGTNLVGKVSIDQVTANANEVVTKSGSVTAATLAAETTKVIGTVNIAAAQTITTTATDLDIRNLVFATDKVDISGSTLAANSGVDIGDVTINNAAGASAVNIQDGGNTITVDGTVSANATLAAETTKVIGTVNVSTGQTITDVPATSGGLSKFKLVSAATDNATNVKASAGQVYAITAFNLNAAPRYLKFHNTAGTPTAGSGVTDTYLIPGNTAGAGLVINIDKGITFATGIGITIVTGITDASTSAVAASEIVVNIYYK
jgi:hypothetical protein